MKRVWALVLAMILAAAGSAVAEGMIGFEEFAENVSALCDGEWKEAGCGDILVMEIEEDVTVSVCLMGKRVGAVTVETLIDGPLDDMAYAVLGALECVDEDALEALGELEDGGEMNADGCVVGRLEGGLRASVYAALEEDFEELVWQSAHGGEKYHDMPACSGMDVSRLVTREAARKAGFEPCGRCKAE